MAIKLADTLAPMADFPAVMAEHTAFEDGETLQEKYETGQLGGGGGGYTQLSQAEYDALTKEEKMNGKEYRTYDTGHIYKLGVEFGKDAYFTSLSQLGLTAPTTVGEVFMAMPNKSMAILSCEAKDEADGTITVSDIPVSYGVLIIKKNGVGRFSIEYQNSSYNASSNVKKWIGTLKGADGTGLKWKELATTDNAIENVPPTNIAFNTDYVTKNDVGISRYEIRNGICYVTMDVTSVVSADAGRVVCTLPKPSSQMQFTIPPYNSSSTIRVGAILFANGNLSFFSLEAGKRYMHTFSYPVAQ